MGHRMAALPQRLLPAGSAWCLQHPRCGLTKGRGWAKEAFSFGRLEACKAMKSWTSPVSARVHLLSRLHQHHQGIPLASSPGPTDSYHSAVRVHPFAALRGSHRVLSNASAVLLFSQGFPLDGFVANDDKHSEKHHGGTAYRDDDHQPRPPALLRGTRGSIGSWGGEESGRWRGRGWWWQRGRGPALADVLTAVGHLGAGLLGLTVRHLHEAPERVERAVQQQ